MTRIRRRVLDLLGVSLGFGIHIRGLYREYRLGNIGIMEEKVETTI